MAGDRSRKGGTEGYKKKKKKKRLPDKCSWGSDWRWPVARRAE
jgi:hypothetical protein